MDLHKLRDEYTIFIEQCYRGHQESFRYFTDLTDYVSRSSTRLGSSSQQSMEYSIDAKPEIPPRIIPMRLTGASKIEGSSITTVEGHLGPSCISPLGMRLQIRPELFIGHLDFVQKSRNRTDFYELPVLHSRQDGIFHFHIFCLVRSPTEHAQDHPTKDLANKRDLLNSACMQAEKELFEDQKYGATRIRRIRLHSQKLVSMEQMISFAGVHDTSQEGQSCWHGILLIDQGIGTVKESLLPWSDSSTSGRPIGLVPIIPYNARLPQIRDAQPPSLPLKELYSILDPLHPFRHLEIRDRIDHELLLADPFFVFATITNLAATTWNMLLNAVEEDISICEQASIALLEGGMEQLRFDLSLISRVDGFAAEASYAINNKGSQAWPAGPEVLLQRKNALQATLQHDNDEIRRRSALLSSRCERATTMLLSIAQLRESQYSTTQADQVTDISRLAFIFIPLSLLVSSFSMNISELNRPPSVWVVITIAVPLSAVAFGLIHRKKIRTWLADRFGAG